MILGIEDGKARNMFLILPTFLAGAPKLPMCNTIS